AALRLANFLGSLAEHQAKQAAGADIDEIEKPVRMPQRTLGEHKSTGDFLKRRGIFQDIGQSFHDRALLVVRRIAPESAPACKQWGRGGEGGEKRRRIWS